jgi:hypothetical protein
VTSKYHLYPVFHPHNSNDLLTGSHDKGHFQIVLSGIGTSLLVLVVLFIFVVWIGGFFRHVVTLLLEMAGNSLGFQGTWNRDTERKQSSRICSNIPRTSSDRDSQLVFTFFAIQIIGVRPCRNPPLFETAPNMYVH